jgi:hypothetical protein
MQGHFMSKTDDALQRMIHIVNEEDRPFNKFDFLDLMKPKTYRNIICKLKKQGIVELNDNSYPAFHTLKGHRFGKSRTPNPMGVNSIIISHNDPIYQIIKNVPMDKACIHDIHLKFKCPNIYKIFSNTPYPITERNMAITIPSYAVNNTILRTTINKNDTVVLIISCTLDPIPLDYNGIIRFFGTLGTVQGFLYCHTVISNHYENVESIPHYWNWIITRWDFGRDASITYHGDKYEIEVKKAQNVFEKLYVKDFRKYKRLRHEYVLTPNKTSIDAINDKLRIPDIDTSVSNISNIDEYQNVQ